MSVARDVVSEAAIKVAMSAGAMVFSVIVDGKSRTVTGQLCISGWRFMAWYRSRFQSQALCWGYKGFFNHQAGVSGHPRMTTGAEAVDKVVPKAGGQKHRMPYLDWETAN
jgi:hypothetical protein